MPSIGTDDLHPPMPGIPREFPGPDDIPYSGGVFFPSPVMHRCTVVSVAAATAIADVALNSCDRGSHPGPGWHRVHSWNPACNQSAGVNAAVKTEHGYSRVHVGPL